MGKEEFRLVSPIYKQNIYDGVFERYGPGESPLNFFDINEEKFGLATEVNYVNMTLTAGDCGYVPAYWYYQSRSTGTFDSIIIT